MYDYIYNVYESIIQNSDSVIIIFLIVLTLGIIIAIIPLYNAVLKGRKVDKQHEREREAQIIEVIKENTAVIAGLKVTLDSSKVDTKATLDRIHQRIDEQNATLSTLHADVTRINTRFDTSLSNQTEMASKINKVLLIVDNIPNSSTFSSQNSQN